MLAEPLNWAIYFLGFPRYYYTLLFDRLRFEVSLDSMPRPENSPMQETAPEAPILADTHRLIPSSDASIRSFFSIFPSSETFSCVANGDGLPCTNVKPLSKKKRSLAESTKRRLSEAIPNKDPADTSLTRLLNDFVEACLCERCPKYLNRQYLDNLVDNLVKTWKNELQTIYDKLQGNPSSIGTVIQRLHGYHAQNSSPEARTDSVNQCSGQKGEDQDCAAIHLRYSFDENDDFITLSAELPESTDPAKLYEILFRSLSHEAAVELKAHLNPESGFKKYILKKPGSLNQLIPTTLATEDNNSGYIYMYRTESAPNFVKIGVTFLEKPTDRLKQWEACCGIRIIDSYTVWTPNARRVEKLIHTELYSDRWQMRCKRQRLGVHNSPQSATKARAKVETLWHNELFETSRGIAVKAINYWTGWMKKHQAYNEKDRHLESEKRGWFKNFSLESLQRTPEAMAFFKDSSGTYWGGPLRETDTVTPSRRVITPSSSPLGKLHQAIDFTQSEPNLHRPRAISLSEEGSDVNQTPSKLLGPKSSKGINNARRVSAPPEILSQVSARKRSTTMSELKAAAERTTLSEADDSEDSDPSAVTTDSTEIRLASGKSQSVDRASRVLKHKYRLRSSNLDDERNGSSGEKSKISWYNRQKLPSPSSATKLKRTEAVNNTENGPGERETQSESGPYERHSSEDESDAGGVEVGHVQDDSEIDTPASPTPIGREGRPGRQDRTVSAEMVAAKARVILPVRTRKRGSGKK
jgi:hypothetical protein